VPVEGDKAAGGARSGESKKNWGDKAVLVVQAGDMYDKGREA
jgi:hypothetical protein